jgi:hypothetical protein
MAFGILIAIGSCQTGLGRLSNPGSGMMTFGIGIFLSLCSLPILIRGLFDLKKSIPSEEEGPWHGVRFKNIALILLSMIIYLILLDTFGFVVAAFVCLFILFWGVGSEKWLWALFESGLTVSLVYLIFVVILDVYLPSFPYL